MNNPLAALQLRTRSQAVVMVASAVVLTLASLLPLFTQRANAAELTDRKVTISTSAPSQSDVEFIFSYNIPNTTATKAGIRYQFCTTPLGTCTATGWTLTGNVHDSQTGWPNNATAFTVQATDLNDCQETTNATTEICYDRDETVATGVTGGAVTHTISGINTNATIQTVYIRISLYSDDDYQTADLLDTGVVAVAIVRQLTVTGRVAERLVFCVFAHDDASTRPADCTAATTNTTVDIGIIDNSAIAQSPVDNNPPTSQGNDRFGSLLVNTNATDGVSVTYFTEPATNVSGGDTDQLRRFRVLPTDCSATTTSTTDQCFIAANSAGENFTAGTERFGMYVACIENNDGSDSTTNNMENVPAAYTGTDADVATGPTTCENEAGNIKFAWNETTSAVEIANSTASSIKVVDDEIVKLRYGATASATTPTGSYTVVNTFIATPQF